MAKNEKTMHADRVWVKADGINIFLVFEGQQEWNKNIIMNVAISPKGAEELIEQILRCFKKPPYVKNIRNISEAGI